MVDHAERHRIRHCSWPALWLWLRPWVHRIILHETEYHQRGSSGLNIVMVIICKWDNTATRISTTNL